MILDSNISEHSHLFDELQEELSVKFQSIIIKLQNVDQYSSIHHMLKATKNELNKVEFFAFPFFFFFYKRN